MIDLQGQNANKSGKGLEEQVENILEDLGIRVIPFSKIGTNFGKKIMAEDANGFLLKNVPYTNMYGGRSFGEFVLQIKDRGPFRIECRKQNVSGSVDEKLPYLIGNCYSFKEKDIILIVEGSGMRAEGKSFLINATKAIAHKNVRVFSLNQFRSWANKNVGGVNRMESGTIG